MIYFLLGIVFWLGCGYVTNGLFRAYWTGEYPTQYDNPYGELYWLDLYLGCVSLVCAFFILRFFNKGKPFKHGFRWWPK